MTGKVILWDVETGEALHAFEGLSFAVYSVASALMVTAFYLVAVIWVQKTRPAN